MLAENHELRTRAGLGLTAPVVALSLAATILPAAFATSARADEAVMPGGVSIEASSDGTESQVGEVEDHDEAVQAAEPPALPQDEAAQADEPPLLPQDDAAQAVETLAASRFDTPLTGTSPEQAASQADPGVAASSAEASVTESQAADQPQATQSQSDTQAAVERRSADEAELPAADQPPASGDSAADSRVVTPDPASAEAGERVVATTEGDVSSAARTLSVMSAVDGLTMPSAPSADVQGGPKGILEASLDVAEREGAEFQRDGAWYYRHADGSIARNELVYLDGMANDLAGGVSKTVYYDDDGRMVYGEREVDGAWRYFKPASGAMAQDEAIYLDGVANNLLNDESKVVFYDEDGSMHYGELEYNGAWYYFAPASGARADDKLVYLDGAANDLAGGVSKTVYYDEVGRMVYGEREVDGAWRYFKPGSGAMAQSEFVYLDGAANDLAGGLSKTVYYDGGGRMVYGEQQLGGAWHYFKPGSGAMAQNEFVRLSGAYLASGPKTVFYDAGGEMVFGLHRFDGDWYYQTYGSGALVTGADLWIVTGDGVHAVHANEDGTLAGGDEAFGRSFAPGLNGIDIASYQRGIRIAATSASFVIAKASEGLAYVNDSFQDFVDQTIAVGRKLGIYHYADGYDAVAEADHFVDTVGSLASKAALFLDYEEPAVMEQGPEWAKAFLDRVYERTGKHAGIYMSLSVAQEQDFSAIAADHPLWVAAYYYGSIPTGWQDGALISSGDFGAWDAPIIYQYSSSNGIAGYSSSDLDLDLFLGTQDDWDDLVRAH